MCVCVYILCIYMLHTYIYSVSDGKESACNVGDPCLIPGLGRSSGKENGNPLQYSCLENPMDRGAWRPLSMGLQRVGHAWVTKHSN